MAYNILRYIVCYVKYYMKYSQHFLQVEKTPIPPSAPIQAPAWTLWISEAWNTVELTPPDSPLIHMISTLPWLPY